MRKAFTLIELMIAITILAIIMTFLYKSYADLNLSNKHYEKISNDISKTTKIKKIIYLDIALSFPKTIKIINEDKDKDVLFLQTTNSIHKRFNPYVAYILKDEKLYRIESLKPFVNYPLDATTTGDVDFIAKTKRFRIYKSKKENNTTSSFLLNLKFDNNDEILYKIKPLNDL